MSPIKKKNNILKRIFRFIKTLGPGLITGASDDDPSGIATYSQAGARYGLATLWTALITFPLMAAIQEICARIGLVTSVGLTTILKHNYSKFVFYLMILFSVPAIILNIGADIAAMGAVANLICPSIDSTIFSVIFTGILLVVIIYLPYRKFVAVLKYLCISLLLYIIVPFLTKTDWWEVLKATFIPTIKWDKDFMSIIVAVLGTTISPYLFFWQTTMEVEDKKAKKQQIIIDKKLVDLYGNLPTEESDNGENKLTEKLIKKMRPDVNIGMFFSNIIMFFIILATGTALYGRGIRNIETVEQAAKALEPVAGEASYLLFAIGVIGTGFLAIPVLSGCLSYIVSETFGWKGNLDKKFNQAKSFYGVIIVSLIVGLLLNYIGISPIKALLYTAILYGITAPVLIAMLLHVANNKKIMGRYTNGKLSNILGVITFLTMAVSAGFLIYLQIAS